jgi:hypothetical protein
MATEFTPCMVAAPRWKNHQVPKNVLAMGKREDKVTQKLRQAHKRGTKSRDMPFSCVLFGPTGPVCRSNFLATDSPPQRSSGNKRAVLTIVTRSDPWYQAAESDGLTIECCGLP